MRIFARKLELDTPSPDPALFDITAEMTFEQLAMFVKHLGLLSKWNGKAPQHEFIRNLALGEATEVVELAANVLTDWPRAFHCLVDTIASEQDHEIRSFRGVLKGIFASFTRSLRGNVFDFARQELASYAWERFRIWSAALWRAGTRTESVLGWYEAARELGVAPVILKRWLETDFARGSWVDEGYRRRWLLTRSEVVRLSRAIGSGQGLNEFLADNGLLSQKAAAAMLGIVPSAFARIVRMGLVSTSPKIRAAGLRNVQLVSHASVSGLLERLEAAAHAVGAPASKHLLPAGRGHWGAIDYLSAATKESIAEVLRTIFAQDLAPVAVDTSQKGLARFLFSISDYKDQRVAQLPPSDTLTLSQTAAVLGLRLPVLWGLLEGKMLTAEDVKPGTNNRARISEAAVEEFMSTYTTTGLIGREYGLTALNVNRVLQRSGVVRIGRSCWLQQEVAGIHTALDEARNQAMTSRKRRRVK